MGGEGGDWDDMTEMRWDGVKWHNMIGGTEIKVNFNLVFQV